MKRILLIANHDAFGRQMARWAILINKHPGWEPIIYISYDYINRHMDLCRADGIKIMGPLHGETAVGSGGSIPNMSGMAFWTFPKAILRRLSFLQMILRKYHYSISLLKFPLIMKSMKKNLNTIRTLLKNERIDVAMICESSPAYEAPLFIAAANMEGIPIATAPIEKSTARHYAENYLYDPSMSMKRLCNKIIGKMYPRWTISHRGYSMLRVQPELLMSLELLGIAPLNPWALVGNQEDIVAVDSQSTFDHFAKEGVAPEQMAIVGRAEYDIMANIKTDAKRLKKELYKRLGFENSYPMILSPLVPDHYISGRPECDFQDYQKLVEFWVKSLGKIKGYNAVISLHPGQTYQKKADAWEYLEQWGVKISRDDLPTLIPLCDIYVATGYSTTVQWAIACGKPVVNYDVYRYGLPIYRSFPGVIDVQEQRDFLVALERLSSDSDYYSMIAAYQQEGALQWGKLDGRATERLIDMFDQLISRKIDKTGQQKLITQRK